MHWIFKLLLNFTGAFNYMLLVGAVLCFIGFAIQSDKTDKSNMYLGVVLIGVVLLTGLMSFYQSSKAANIMA